MAEFDLSTSKKIIQVKGLINRPVHSRPLTHELHVQVKSQPLTHILETTYGTPAPPGAPALWYDGNDFDGSLNSTLTHGDTLTAWTNKGSLAGANLTANGAPVTFSTADGVPSMKKPNTTNGGLINTTLGTIASGDFTYVLIFRIDVTSHGGQLHGFNDSGGVPHSTRGLGVAGFPTYYLEPNPAWSGSPNQPLGQLVANRWEYLIIQRRETPDFQLGKQSGNAAVFNTNSTDSRTFNRISLPGSGAFGGNESPMQCHIAQVVVWDGYDPAAPTLAAIETWAQTAVGQVIPFVGTP